MIAGIRILFCVVVATWLVGCGHVKEVAKPTDITVKDAVLELADTFYEAQRRGIGRQKVGLIVDEATVEFNVAAKATNKSNIGAEGAGIPLGVGGTLKLTVANEAYSEGSRGNKVTIKFKNLATAAINKDGLAYLDECQKNPKKPGCGTIIMMMPPP